MRTPLDPTRRGKPGLTSWATELLGSGEPGALQLELGWEERGRGRDTRREARI